MAAPIYSGGPPFIKSGLRTREILVASGATIVTLKKSQSNEIFKFDSASAGIAYTLPAPVVGLSYTFITTVLQTGGVCKVTTSGAPVYLVGSVVMYSGEKVTPSSTLGPYQFNALIGSVYITFTMDGTTQGGGVGTRVNFTCISTTQWYVTGVVNSPSGNLATPFTT